jgi:hypothetical protein
MSIDGGDLEKDVCKFLYQPIPFGINKLAYFYSHTNIYKMLITMMSNIFNEEIAGRLYFWILES